MEKKYDIVFFILDHVHIIQLDRPGRVIGIWIGRGAIEYQVRYFDNCEARTVYFFEDELRMVTK